MLLVIDAGNSNVTLGVFEGAELLAQWRLVTEHNRSSEEYGAEVQDLFEVAHLDPEKIVGVAIASVVPSLNEVFNQVVESCFKSTPMFVDHTSNTGLKILYETPADLGADRIVDAVAAVEKYGAPCIVVD